MKDPSIALHRTDGSVIMVRPEHIGSRRPASRTLDPLSAKTVVLIDGQRQAVCESMEEIAKLIREA